MTNLPPGHPSASGGPPGGGGPATPDEELLVEAVATAFRPRDPRGGVAFLPAWHDLDAAGRSQAFELARTLRRVEAALDPEGLSTTARAVLARVRGSR